jgi:hypothetical protein
LTFASRLATRIPQDNINKENKREREEGEVDADPSPKAPPKKKAKSSCCCELHGCGQNHNADKCEILNAEFKKLKQNRKPRPFSGQQQINPNIQQSNAKPKSRKLRRSKPTLLIRPSNCKKSFP